MPLPLTVLLSTDDVLRQTTASGLLCDLPDAVVVQHDLGEDTLRRLVYDTAGPREDTPIHLEHNCLTCALREDVVPTVARLASTGRWRRIVLALPVTAGPALVLDTLHGAVVGGRRLSDLAVPSDVVTAVALGPLLDDLFGDDLLGERGLALAHDDRRAVGEVLAHQVEAATVLATSGRSGPDGTELAVLRHLAPPSTVVGDLHELDFRAACDRDTPVRLDPCDVRPSGAADGTGVWTLPLASWRPAHPARLRERLADLGLGRHRSRGRFWLPTRPRALCRWDGAGGQLSIGTVGRWDAAERETRLVVTGIEPDRDRLRAAFDAVLMTDTELARGLARWEGVDDGFSPWLGDIDRAA